MKKHDHPDISFLHIDVRLAGPLCAVVLSTVLMSQAPHVLIPFAVIVCFAIARFSRWRSLLILSLIFLLFQSGNIWVRGISEYFTQPTETWQVKIIGETSLSQEYLVSVLPENSGIFQQPVKAKVKFSGTQPELGDAAVLTGELAYDKFGFSIKNPTKISISKQQTTHLLAHQKIREHLQGKADDTDIGLFLGITYGDDSLIERADKDNFRAVGITHMTAVSGSNIAMVAAATFTCSALALRRRRPALITTLVFTFAYCAFVGLDGSVLRAFIFAMVGFFAAVGGRSKNAVSLCLSALVLLLLFQPLLLWDVGFVLSAGVTLGLVTICQPLTYLLIPKIGELLAVFFSANIVAHLVSTPLSAFYFGKVYTYSFLANVVVAPMVPIILALGIIYLLVYVLYGVSVDIFLYIAHPVLFLIEKLSAYLARLSGSVLEVHNGFVLAFLVAVPLAVSCIIVRYGRRYASETPEPLILI